MLSTDARHTINNLCGFDAVVAVTCKDAKVVPADHSHVRAALYVTNSTCAFSDSEIAMARAFFVEKHREVAGILACLSAMPTLTRDTFRTADTVTPFLSIRELVASHAAGENLARAAFENTLSAVRHVRKSPFLHHHHLSALALATEGLVLHDRGQLSTEHQRLLGNCLCCGDDRIEVTISHAAARLSINQRPLAEALIAEISSRSGYGSQQAIREHPLAEALAQTRIPLDAIAAFKALPENRFLTNLANVRFFRSRWRADG